MFPKTMSENPLAEAMEFTINSGAEVPKDTMVKPITKSEVLFFFAKDEAPFTSQFAPKIKLVNPSIIKIEERIIWCGYFFKCTILFRSNNRIV